MNPDTLREMVYRVSTADGNALFCCADAWEADIKDARVYERMANRNADVIADLRQRLEAAEKALQAGRSDAAKFVAQANQVFALAAGESGE